MIQYEQINRWISALYRCNQMYMAKHLKAHGVGMGQHMFLMCIHKLPGISQDELTRHTFLNKSSVARAIGQLEKNGLLTRQVNPADKRAYRLYLTPRGEAARGAALQFSNRHVEQMTAGFTQPQKDQALTLLEQMAHNVLALQEEGKKETEKENEQ